MFRFVRSLRRPRRDSTDRIVSGYHEKVGEPVGRRGGPVALGVEPLIMGCTTRPRRPFRRLDGQRVAAVVSPISCCSSGIGPYRMARHPSWLRKRFCRLVDGLPAK